MDKEIAGACRSEDYLSRVKEVWGKNKGKEKVDWHLFNMYCAQTILTTAGSYNALCVETLVGVFHSSVVYVPLSCELGNASLVKPLELRSKV